MPVPKVSEGGREVADLSIAWIKRMRWDAVHVVSNRWRMRGVGGGVMGRPRAVVEE